MGRKAIDLEAYKHRILDWIDHGESQIGILEKLERECNLEIGKRSLQRWLTSWGVSRTNKPQFECNEELGQYITQLFWEMGEDDETMCELLQEEGVDIGARTLRRVRMQLGLRKRLTAEQVEERHAEIERRVSEALDNGNIKRYGRVMLAAWARQQRLTIAAHRLFSIVKTLDPVGVQERWHDRQRHRTAYIVEGPNKVWSIDGHDKLRHYGIEIYGGIDAYSRCVVWFYCGNSNRTAVSVLHQYLTVLLMNGGYRPQVLRSDRGKETPVVADVHFEAAWQQDPTLNFADVWAFGRSVENVRIESWWAQLTKHEANYWLDFFQEMEKAGRWTRASKADRVALLAVFVPIIREWTRNYVELWNLHKIRAQKKRHYLVSGRPMTLYRHPERQGREDYAVPVDRQWIVDKLAEFQDYDPDAFLPGGTWQWCREKAKEGGYELVPQEGVQLVNPDGTKVYVGAYDYLRQALKEHMAGPNEPQIEELGKPWGAWKWFKDRAREAQPEARTGAQPEARLQEQTEAHPEEMRIEIDEEREEDIFETND